MIRSGGAALLGLLSCFFLGQAALAQTYTIQTLVGYGSPISGSARAMEPGNVGGIAVDRAGNLYAALPDYSLVVKIDPSGHLTRFAGNGTQWYGGDGGPAISAQLGGPSSVAVDAKGDVFIQDAVLDSKGIDSTVTAIRRVDASTGIISTISGQTTFQPGSIVADASGNVYVLEGYAWDVRRIDANSGIITTVVSLYGGPLGSGRLALDAAGNLYVANGGAICRVDAATGTITIVAGPGTGALGDGGPATQATFDKLGGIAIDSQGNIFAADGDRIRKIDAVTGIIRTVAGGNPGGYYSGDGGPATAAQIEASFVAVDPASNLFLGDYWGIRKVNTAGIISTVTGESAGAYYSGDGGPVAGAQLSQPTGVAVDSRGNIYVSDAGNGTVRKVDASTGIITTVAGNGTSGFSGDNGPAVAAELYYPRGIALDRGGNLYIVDSYNHRVRRVDAATGIITTVAGNGDAGQLGDGGPATSAQFVVPYGIAVDGHGNFYVSDPEVRTVRRVSGSTGIIYTVLDSWNSSPSALAVDAAGNVFVSSVDQGESGVLWKLDATTMTQTIVNIKLAPTSIAVDGTGNLYIGVNCGVAKLDTSGTVTQIAGDCGATSPGDGGPALLAALGSPSGLALGPGGVIYAATNGLYYPATNRVRVLTPSGNSGGCSIEASPTNFAAPAGGGSFTVSVQTALPTCFWSIAGLPGWITPSSYSGFGAATVTLTVAPYVGPARSASLAVAGTPV